MRTGQGPGGGRGRRGGRRGGRNGGRGRGAQYVGAEHVEDPAADQDAEMEEVDNRKR